MGLEPDNIDGQTPIDENGDEASLTEADIKIITPYNAQVQGIKQRLPDYEVETVDKFQGAGSSSHYLFGCIL